MRSVTRSEILACVDAIALEVAGKIAEYERIQKELERLRAQVAPAENIPRKLDTHEMVSRLIPRRRTA